MHGEGKMFADGKLTEGKWEKGAYVGEGQAPLVETKTASPPPPTESSYKSDRPNVQQRAASSNFQPTTRPSVNKLKKKPSLLRKLSSGIRTVKFYKNNKSCMEKRCPI